MTLFIVLLFCIIFNLILFFNYKYFAKLNNVFDIPDNNRKIHNLPIPLLGGLILYINIILYLVVNYFFYAESLILFETSTQLIIFTIVISLFFFLGRIDDKKDLNSLLKFFLMSLFITISIIFDHEILIKNLVFSFTEKEIPLGGFAFFFTTLCFLLFINAFNMLDGINAQAATYTLIIFIIFILQGRYSFFLILLGLSLFIYIFYNLKNLMFLGDSGSLILGFFISYICIKAYNQGYIVNSDEIFLIMCIPGYELLRLFIKRIFIYKNPFSADTNHMHHYLMKKYNFLQTFCSMQILMFLPIISFIIFKKFYISFFLSLISYFLLLFILTSSKKK